LRRVVKIWLIALLTVAAAAQAPNASVSGKVTDQTGAVIPQATVVVTGPAGQQTTATTDQAGAFAVHGLAPGSYSVAAQAKGFTRSQKDGVTLQAGQNLKQDFSLEVHAQEEKVDVQGEQNQLDVSSSSNAGAIIIKGKDLEALSDDPDELQSELQALAGPAAGPNGGQIYIDGFTGGQLPPKSSIREIRVNQNPFSAQYDKLGYGRIEILTKPGSDHYHGQFFFNDNNAVLNSRNPYVPTKPDYNSEMFDGNFGGPINKKASFFIDASRRNIDEFSAINATTLDSNLNPTQVQESISSPRTRTSINPRIDYQVNANNTFTARYQLTHDTDQDSGLTQFSLPEQAFNLNETEHTVQISDTQILNPRVVNETRFQFQREISHQLPLSTAPTIQVQGAFTGGGSARGAVRNTENNYELQNYTSIVHGNHLIKFGGRLRALTLSNSSDANFNGTFVFSPIVSNGMIVSQAIDVYRQMLQCQQSGGSNCAAASQFSIVAGSPQVSVNWFDAGLYAEDEWRIRPNLSFTYGLRFESQNNIYDHGDFAPRLGIAWGVGSNGKSAPKFVLRGGFGIFYDRFGYNLVEQSELLNGVTQQSVTITDPTFFSATSAGIPPFGQLQSSPGSAPTIYQIASNLRAPYTIQSAASVERQITKAATVSVTYLNSRGEHALYIDNRTAAFSAGQIPPQNVYEYQSGGVFRQNQLIANARITAGRRLSLFGFYTLSYANSNASSGNSPGGFFSSGTTSFASFVSNQSDPMADYGRAAFDLRHRAFIGGNISLPRSFSLSPFIIINSGQPYNLTTGQDNNLDSIFNDRPFFATGTNGECTLRSSFSTSTGTAQVPVNYCTGPGNATFNLRLSKTIGFGREVKGGGGAAQGGPGGGRGGGPRGGGGLGPGGLSGNGGNMFFGPGGATNRRYGLTFSISARNLLNSFNPGPPVGNLSSPFFGESIALAGGPFSSASANRRVDLQVRFSF
jgi:hypothetical protein